MNVDCVLDTSSLIAYIREELGAEQVRKRLRFSRCLMHAINVAEFLFTAPKRMPGLFTPESAFAWFTAADIDTANILDPDFLQTTAKIRLAERSLSLGDGMAIALASMLEVPVVTSERNFKKAGDYANIELIR